MPSLRNAKQELYAQAVAKGMLLCDAYVAAGYKAHPSNPSRLAQEPAVAERIREILSREVLIEAKAIERAVEKTALDRAWVLTKLQENFERAMVAKPVYGNDGEPTGEYTYQGSVANRALELIGKEIGMFINRTELKRVDDLDHMSADDLRAEIAKELALERAEAAASEVVKGTRH